MERLGFILGALEHDLKAQQRVEMHQALVREVIRMRIKDRDKAHQWLYGRRDDGKETKGFMQLHPTSTLDADVIDQWKKGNRGSPGEWK